MKLEHWLMRSKFKTLLNSNFGFTTLAKVTDLGLKFGVLLFFMRFREKSDLVEYTYFLSLGAILGVIFDWGGARYNVREVSKSGNLPLNLISIVICVIVFFAIMTFKIIAFKSVVFLGLCCLYALTTAWITTFMKYYEYTNNNKELFKEQVVINLACTIIISVCIICDFDLIYSYLILIVGNVTLLIRCILFNRGKVQFMMILNLLIKGAPFLINTIAVMAFSQINIVILNQISRPEEIANFVLAQRIMEVSLMLPNSFASSEIGKFFKGNNNFRFIQKKSIKLWLLSFIGCIIMIIVIKKYFPQYDAVLYLFLLLVPLGLVRTVSAAYSIVLDYTKYFMVRTYAISVILILNICLAKYVIGLPGGLYVFCLYIGTLISFLQLTYWLTFKKYNIYEAFYNKF